MDNKKLSVESIDTKKQRIIPDYFL